jgi:hypothetical protein
MKKYFLMMMMLTGLLAGCSMTPEQARAIGDAMSAGGQRLDQRAREMRQQAHEQNLVNSLSWQQPIIRQPLNCTTTYSTLMRAYETQCQ